MKTISRYLEKEIFYHMISITSIMVFIFICNRMIRFLQFLAEGKYGADFLIHMVLLQIPILFGLFLSLGLFLGILLSFGRLYVDSEMIVLLSCGISRKQLLSIVLKISTIVFFVIAMLVFFLNPYIEQRQDKLLKIIQTKTIFQTILPGQFQSSSEDQEVFYIKKMDPDRTTLGDLFIAERIKNDDNHLTPNWAVLSAKSGYQKFDPETLDHFMVAVNGKRYEGIPGEQNFEITHFHEYGLRLPSPSFGKYDVKAKSLPTLDLIKSVRLSKADMAELQWRISMPITAVVLTLLAIPLSRVRPRHGRFGKLWIAIIIYIIYANLLLLTRNWISESIIPAWIGMWWVHIIFFISSFWLLQRLEHETR